MAARRGRSQARRSGGNRNNSLPGWAWLVLGVLLTLIVVLLAPRFMAGDDARGGFFRIGGPEADPDARPRGSAQADDAFEPVASSRPATPSSPPAPAASESPTRADYDFYDLLPGEEVAMTDAQIAAIAREEARRKAAAERAAASANDAAAQAADAHARAAAAAGGLPQPLPEQPRPTASATPQPARPTTTAEAPTTASSTAPAAPSAAAAGNADSSPATPYILQAGAFQASGDAEALKARIALLGLSARVESATINGKTMYRVRTGPYASAAELASAKSKLDAGGLQSVAIRAK
ncbi:SPOR domain-containing protein [Luteimonas sp. e5]